MSPAARWTVPVGNADYGFNAAASTGSYTAGTQGWTTMDLNNDGRPDLVAHSLGNGNSALVFGGLAAPYWNVYLNTGSGFAAAPTRWTVPVGNADYGFNVAASTGSYRAGAQGWTTMDLNNDGRPDLVTHSLGNGNNALVFGGLAAPYWNVYLNDLGPLSTVPATRASLAAYPVPFTRTLTLETAQALGQAYSVWDSQGRRVAQGLVVAPQLVLELGDLPAGIYIIRLDGAQARMLKVAKQ